ncbi:hypothetical protein RI570_11470 [Brucella pseudogrignonensis]|uniref:hypothetical protein n=1 Tax=Brucella pseudogrignonensis TaxID=419475 RepID=UPI0028BCA970|nr:hypothetical protein [Brucella pseudogrignonensis]MDT6940767.1 hypothetical protein [Brucella pseudogrignonensis]
MTGPTSQRVSPPVILKWLPLRKRIRLATKIKQAAKALAKRICPETADYPTIEEQFNIPTSGERK